jgi:hypothetical protein
VSTSAEQRRRLPGPLRWRGLREVLLLGGVFGLYKLGRVLFQGGTDAAFRNAHRVWDFERLVHLPNEAAVQDALLSSGVLVRAANVYYATVHFPATIGFLVWMYLRRPGHYPWARNAIILLTAAALVLHGLVPLAPPRMLPEFGMIDTGARYGPSVYGPPQHDNVNNQFAAMPSLHAGWAMLVAVGLIVTSRRWWRWLWVGHPALVVLVVVGTANHYWLDAIVGGTLLGGVLLLLAVVPRAP